MTTPSPLPDDARRLCAPAITEAVPGDVRMSAALAGVRAVYYALMLWIPIESFFVFGAKENSSSSKFTVSRLLGLLLFGLALIEWRRCFRRIPAAFFLIAWYIAVCALSQLFIPRALDARFMESQVTMLQLVILFLVSSNLFEDSVFRREVLRFYGWWISLVAVGMMLGIFGGQFMDSEGRTSISGQDPNFVASLYALGAICIAGNTRIFASKRFILRILAGLIAVSALILAIIQTGSRGGLLSFVAGILGLAICGGRSTRKQRLLITVAVIGMFGAMVLREFQQGSVAAARLSATWNEGDTAGRTRIYDEAWKMFLDKPLMGYGAVNNYYTLGAHMNNVSDRMYYRDTHNLLLAVLTEVGLVGAVPFLAAMLFALWNAWRYGRQTDDAVPFALMCALITINSSLTWYHQKIFWVVLAVAVACTSERDACGPSGAPANLSSAA